jgi:dolichol-phosphate mannosyltransferase
MGHCEHLKDVDKLPTNVIQKPKLAISTLLRIEIVFYIGYLFIWNKTCECIILRTVPFHISIARWLGTIHWDVKVMKYNERIMKFPIVGCSAGVVNFLLIAIFIELFGFKGYFLKNLANILAIEISTLYNFLISRLWTWKDAPRKQGRSLFGQFISFNLAALTGIGLRAILFPILENCGVFYLVNVAIGIGIAAFINFILYDKFVFRRGRYQKRALENYSALS